MITYGEMYVVYITYNDDSSDPRNGYISKSSDLVSKKILKILNTDVSDDKDLLNIKRFFSKKTAYSFLNETEKLISNLYPDKNVRLSVRTKVLPIEDIYNA